MEIRLFQPQDVEPIAQLFHDTVHRINAQDYSPAQLEAWAPANLHFRNWLEACSARVTYVAEEQGVVMGFAELETTGRIDCFYCHASYQGCGIGTQLYQALEAKALSLGIKHLTTEASITAQGFFTKMGFTLLQEQRVLCRGQSFVNYQMAKCLEPATRTNPS
ncbi:MAG: GNAT family N-acetyltransferase [Acaryochloridaceae cyanobacterium SU_2_1]|nr:GNAT family N-acetyltransferase [Acaryochloridaceae cyanobacterium SU_2_1]